MAKRLVIEICSSDEDHSEEERKTEREVIVLDDEEEKKEERAKPIGDVVRVTGSGTMKRKHYASFKLKGYVYKLEMTVLLKPDHEMERAYVAIIRDISEDTEDNLWVKAQWFYRPEDLPELDEHWEEREGRVLYYSFHCDEVPAESMINNCTVHFVPSHKKVPANSELYGMVVQKVYDIVEKKLFDITDEVYEDREKREIDMLIQTTRERIGELPDILTEDASVQQNDYSEDKKNLEKKIMDQINASGVDPTTVFDQLAKAYTPGSSTIAEVSKYHAILSKSRSLTGDAHRDKWLENLLQVTQHVCNSEDALSGEDKHSENVVSSQNSAVDAGGSYNNSSDICWEEEVIPILSELERVTYEAMGDDFQKYNQKMRQLHFNLKNSTMLAKRLLKKELEPIALLTMTPEELKEGLTAEERITKEPEKPEQMRMTDTRCSRCMEKQVGVTAVIQTGDKEDHYQLECLACGQMCFASRDIIIFGG